MFWGIRRVIGSAENCYAELDVPAEAVTLSCIIEGKKELTEPILASLLSKIFRSKNSLLQANLSEVCIRPELVFLEQSGKIHITAVDNAVGCDIFADIVTIFRSLMKKRTQSSNAEDMTLSKALVDLLASIDKLQKLNYSGKYSDLH